MMSTFGDEVDAIWPPLDGESKLGLSEFGQKLLKQCKTLKKPDAEATVDVKRFMRQSSDFPLEVGAVFKQSSSTFNLQSLCLSSTVRCAELPCAEPASGAA